MSLGRRLERTATVSVPWRARDVGETESLALFAAGCFWGVESLFRGRFGHLPSFLIQAVYAGDPQHAHPTYDNLGDHAEAVLIRFEPSQIAYFDLVLFFFQMHDPTEKDRQGNDRGRQYRSRIWTFSEEQEREARKVRDRVNLHYQKNVNGQLCATKILPATPENIWTAERYHQRYIAKHPDGYHCESHYVRDQIR